jgi:TolB protein
MQYDLSFARASLRELCVMTLGFSALACSNDNPTQSPLPFTDARLVAFSTTSGNDVGLSISIMHADGTAATRVTSAGFLDEGPAWSPDGASIAFDTNRIPAGIWIVGADGTNLHPFLTSPAFDQPSGIAWSPDGHRIAFTAHVDSTFAIFVADSTGSNAHRLTANAHGEQRPAWSPDGLRIAFEARATDSSDTHLFVIGADGTDLQQLTTDAFDGGAHWSPDGTRIAFDRIGAHDTQIFLMNADGSNQHALTPGGVNFGAAWSPDGLQFEYTVVRNAQNQIVRMNADGSDVRTITGTSTNAFPAWKPAP